MALFAPKMGYLSGLRLIASYLGLEPQLENRPGACGLLLKLWGGRSAPLTFSEIAGVSGGALGALTHFLAL